MEALHIKLNNLFRRKRYNPLRQPHTSRLSQEGKLLSRSSEALHDADTPRALQKAQVGQRMRDVRDNSTQVDESLLARNIVQRDGASCSLTSLPHEITLLILEILDIVSLVSLKLTSKRFFETIAVKKTKLNACAKWAITCLLEQDLIAKGAPLPTFIACFFCKEKHPAQRLRPPPDPYGIRFRAAGDGEHKVSIQSLLLAPFSQKNQLFAEVSRPSARGMG